MNSMGNANDASHDDHGQEVLYLRPDGRRHCGHSPRITWSIRIGTR